MIDFDSLTYGEIKKIAAMAGLVAGQSKNEECCKRKVIVRSYGAGVFYGELVSKRENEVELTNCRRIWNWKGANTCSELALTGLTPSGSKVAKPTPKHTVLDVIEIIDCSPEAAKLLESATWS